MLYIVPTPIGCLLDITDRAREVLAKVDLIACEDTRVTGKLLQHLGIKKPMIAYRDDNERAQSVVLLDKIKNGQHIALVSDAGTPTISDPGFRLVRAVRQAGLPITPLPGPCAAITALSASGLPSDQFFFAGFLPQKQAGRAAFFKAHQEVSYTVIAYESCHRISKTVVEAQAILGGQRVVAIAREITKRFESFYVGCLSDVAEKLLKDPIKGEYVFILAPHRFQL